MNGARDLLVSSAGTLFESHCTRETLDRAEAGEWAADLWQAIADAGLDESTLSEEQGGAGLGFADAMAVLKTAGRFAAPVPLAEAIVVAWLCSATSRPTVRGPVSFFLACRSDDSLTMERGDDGWTVRGAVGNVPFARFAKTLVGVCAHEEQLVLFELAADRCRIDPEENLASDARDTVYVDSQILDAKAVSKVPVGLGSEQVRSRWSLTRVAMMSGALEYLLDVSIEYARGRIQFGRPIGRFQAMQQQLAVMAGEVAAATAAADAAAQAADDGPALVEIAAAKGRVGEAATKAVAIAHQVHGAIGFTHEHDLHTRTRRLWAWRDELGTEGESFLAVGRHFSEVGAERMWPELVDP